MSFVLDNSLAAAVLFFGMLVSSEVGRRIGISRIARDPDGITQGSGPVEAAVFGLLGLLLAFTFAGAGERFEARRHLVAEEANAIGTAYLRVDLLPADVQPGIRGLFRRYVDARLLAYRDLGDAAATEARQSETVEIQMEIWAAVVSACRRQEVPGHVPMLVLPAINQMVDITTTRDVAVRTHPPSVIFVLLFGSGLACALLMGYVMCRTRARNWFYILVFAATVTTTFEVIRDLEHPRLGLIRIDAVDQVLVDLRNSMR